MAEDDIYGNKEKYERAKATLEDLAVPQFRRKGGRGSVRKFYCKTPTNLQYFRKLFAHFEARDVSYVRRNRVLQTVRIACHATTKDLADCDRDDINKMLALVHEHYRSPESIRTFVTDLKHVWKVLFPETDARGRPDDTLIPYAVRHLSGRIDKSRQKLREDKLSWEEFERVVNYFGADP